MNAQSATNAQVHGNAEAEAGGEKHRRDNHSVVPLRRAQDAPDWRGILAKSALFYFGIALWSKGLSLYAYYILVLAWVLDGGLSRFRETAREPLVLGMLALCGVLALGISWGDARLGFKVWNRYAACLIFIPYFAILTPPRLSWAIGGALAGYGCTLLIGLHQRIAENAQGIPPLGITYLDFSAMLGIGVILAAYFAGTWKEARMRPWFWLAAILLLLIQFSQNGRGLLVATLASLALLIFLLHGRQLRRLLAISAILLAGVTLLIYHSDTFQQRFIQAMDDIELSAQGKYGTSLGYRLAIWDVGLHGIAQKPVQGHGMGMAAPYFDATVETYKDGLYKDLPDFLQTYHYHNDWVEIGMQMGMLGMSAYAFFLWSWLRTLKGCGLATIGTAYACFILLFGTTDVLVIFRQNLYLLLAMTAIGVVGRRENIS
ncbi:O-antigen ligase [Nitrosovibrio sp. Nv17]|uniref:O-antigen ligase family protein n=1 Tax=Nitrosovibrio sp. Nv17 TaxID=1855339 RepID=UPI000908C2CF|nr:O-antigen ligase family protein [Nitrosovibrio sp. Nv17]SFW21907.1 O-antigen ligase [Nitrosovibrio sp. Nv17]